MITQKELYEVAEELKQAALPAERCEYCKTPVYRLPFQTAPKINDKIMCLQCMGLWVEYEKLNTNENNRT